jgi:small subunit ribosomal protein S2
MKDVSLLDLLKSGAHFGHKTSRWNPKMKPFIFTVRNDIHILDLEKTKKGLLKAASFATDVAGKGGTILFIATKRQSRDIVKAAAESCGMPYVNVRWLGGTFTNFRTIQKTVRKMEKLMEQQTSENYNQRYTKKERLLIDREVEKMQKLFAGIKDLRRMPEAVFIADINHDDIALKEAMKMKIKIMGVVDSNSNPDAVDFVIPANDDATQAIELVSAVIAEAINDGKATSTATRTEVKTDKVPTPVK